MNDDDDGGGGGDNYCYLPNTCHMPSIENQTSVICSRSKQVFISDSNLASFLVDIIFYSKAI